MVASTESNTLLELKDKGNDCFKKGEYSAAIALYTEALAETGGKSSADAATLHKNRAACLLKLERFDEVVEDINVCISMGGGDSKAYYRRAVAYQSTKQLDKALKDSMEAVRIDPKNKTAIDLVMALRRDIQSRRDLMTSTTGLVDEMLGSLREERPDVDKTTQALKNLVTLSGTKPGCETVMQKDGLKDILKHLHSENKDHQIHVLNCMMCLLRDSVSRTELILKKVPLESSLRILRQKDAASSLIGGILYEMLNSILEDRNYDYSKRELGQPIKKFPVPRLLPRLFGYFKECSAVAEGEPLNSLINAVVKVTDSRVINEALLHNDIIHYMISLVTGGQLSHGHSQQISVIISKVWNRARIDGKETLNFVKQISKQITPRFLSGEELHQMHGLRALNVVLQGSFEAGGDIVKDTAELYRVISKLLCSSEQEAQRTAAEAVALIASDKKMCYNLADQNFNLLKALYKNEAVDDTVKLRALVGMSKMSVCSGGDTTRNIIAEGAALRLFRQIRHYLIESPTDEVRMWVVEALAYLTIDAEVKHELVFDDLQMKTLCDFTSDLTPNTAYALACVFMNVTNSYEKPDIEPEMVRIAEYAKQNVPKEHELDGEEALKQRISKLISLKTPTVLSTCSAAESERTREFLARSYFAIVSSEDGVHCGAVVQMGGTRSLLNLFQENTDEGKKYAAHAIARIAVKMNPALAFSGQRSLDACRPCLSLIKSIETNTFLVYDGLMALTNLASVSDSVRERIIREGGCHDIEYQQLEDSDALRRAATEVICNMALSEKFRERYRPENESGDTPPDRLKAVFVFCGDESYHIRLAALGAMAYLTSDAEICKGVINIGSFEEIVKELICVEDPALRHRLFVMLQNMIASDKAVAEKIINTAIFECLLALMQVPNQPPAMKTALTNCMEAAKHWGLIERNPGDMVYAVDPAQ